MGHRHLFSTPEVFEMDHDQNRNHPHVEQPSLHLGRASALENGSFIAPMENMSNGGVNFAPHWNSALRSNEYSSSSVMDLPHYQLATSGPSYDPFVHSSVAGNFCPIPQNYSDRPSSSSYHAHIIHGPEAGIDDSAVVNGRGPCKRKSPALPSVCDGSSSSRSYNAGSSSDLTLSSDLQPEKPISGSQHCPWVPMGVNPSYRGNNLSIAEGSQRNVRSRSTLDLEADLARTHLSNNPYHHLHSTGPPPVHHSDVVDLTGQSVNATTREWNRVLACPAARGRIIASDTSGLSHGMDQLIVGSSSTDNSVDFSGYRHDLVSSRHSVPPHNIHSPVPQIVRGHGSYPHRALPAYRATSSYPRSRYVATSSEDGPQSLPEAFSSRHSRPVSTIGWRSTDRSGRPRIYYERLRALADEADAHDRLVSEGLMMVDRSALYGSRNPFDQHRDMRLDIDNMSYEELLALGERIGNVNTGLSEDLISKCLKETIYILDQIHEHESCVICLEEYKNKEEVGTLKKCGHDYHVGCIKKWLLMKNVCPICKAPAMGDNLKEK